MAPKFPLDIILGQGVGPLRFGMLIPEVVKIAGMPESIQEDFDEPGDTQLSYDDGAIELIFCGEEGGRLSIIGLLPGALINGLQIPVHEPGFVTLFHSLGIKIGSRRELEGTEEGLGWFYESEDASLTAFFDDEGWMESISLGPILDEDDKILWPWPEPALPS